MKITLNNYFDVLDDYMAVIESNASLKNTHEFLMKATENGKDFSVYDKSDSIKETIDLYLKKLKEFKAKEQKPVKSGVKPATTSKQPAAPKKSAAKPKEVNKAPKPAVKRKEKQEPEADAEKVEHIPSDIALVKRYIALHGKDKTYDQVLAVWRSFNKAIVERKVTKDSPYKSEIAAMNKSIGMALEDAKSTGSLHLVIPKARLNIYERIAASVEKSASVPILLEYINISGKQGMQERAQKLLKRIERATATGKLKGDRYAKDMKTVIENLEAYINRETDTVMLTDYTLNGIGEVAVFGCPCQNGIEGFTSSQNAVIYKLIDEKVRNLKECELDRAFADTVAPSICKAIAQRLIDGRQLTMSLIRNPAKVSRGAALNGGNYGFNLDTEILDMRLRSAGSKAKVTKEPRNTGFSGLGATVAFSQPPAQEEVKIISAKELMTRKFRTIGLTGKYRQLIGDPEPGFSAMIYGKPKSGKSTLAIDFAKELTRRGKVLYCAFEEGHGYTLQDKVKRNNADVPGLDFANRLPQDFNAYRYVFIDSVSDAKLDEAAFGSLVKASKAKEISILGVFHATKGGNFRGGQTFAHDVDVLIKVEDGVAYAQGRFAAPQQIDITALTNTHRRLAA